MTIQETAERYPNLQTILMVEKFIEKNSGEYKKTKLFNNLPKKMINAPPLFEPNENQGFP